jgi:hypothetical protein
MASVPVSWRLDLHHLLPCGSEPSAVGGASSTKKRSPRSRTTGKATKAPWHHFSVSHDVSSTATGEPQGRPPCRNREHGHGCSKGNLQLGFKSKVQDLSRQQLRIKLYPFFLYCCRLVARKMG